MFREGRALRKFFRVVIFQRHMPNTPRVERDFQRRFKWRAGLVFDVRTVLPDELPHLARAIFYALEGDDLVED